MRCPVCGREASSGVDSCRRCGADLSRLWRLRTICRSVVNDGYAALRNGDLEAAEHLFEKAIQTDSSEAQAIRGYALVRLMQRNFHDACRWHGRLRYCGQTVGDKPESSTVITDR